MRSCNGGIFLQLNEIVKIYLEMLPSGMVLSHLAIKLQSWMKRLFCFEHLRQDEYLFFSKRIIKHIKNVKIF